MAGELAPLLLPSHASSGRLSAGDKTHRKWTQASRISGPIRLPGSSTGGRPWRAGKRDPLPCARLAWERGEPGWSPPGARPAGSLAVRASKSTRIPAGHHVGPLGCRKEAVAARPWGPAPSWTQRKPYICQLGQSHLLSPGAPAHCLGFAGAAPTSLNFLPVRCQSPDACNGCFCENSVLFCVRFGKSVSALGSSSRVASPSDVQPLSRYVLSVSAAPLLWQTAPPTPDLVAETAK